ncbi:hypothetical protein N7510_003201 [Penicillium lagena]|uniref:uncharacterized protein n=1 Tax=Penicillium lagena TaxID=94218 RepID=UPI002541AF5C|nr:uncharacterized protein N7510_003201 [Penicillium lagena]KAJ5619217.1 hypothetical protein N7510_003201 [Penicillium lagena]
MFKLFWSSPFSQASTCLVGTLTRWDPSTHQTSSQREIYSTDDIYIGRDKRACQFVIPNQFVSNKHLRIYTILYDRDILNEIPPLVYTQDLSLNGTLWNDYPMGQGKGSFLLSDGDTLRITQGEYLRFNCARDNRPDTFSCLQRIEMREFNDHYVITPRILGSGAYGRVHMAFKKGDGQQLACKIIDLQLTKAKALETANEEQMSKFFIDRQGTASKALVAVRRESFHSTFIRERLEAYQQEALILQKLSHPNIIRVEKAIRSSNTIYIFQELITAGDLFSFLSYKGGRLEDIPAAVVIHQILLALDYLHEQSIVHRDLKPDNVLMTSLDDGARVVLTDFGCARYINAPVQRMSTIVGTAEYCAPEVNTRNERGYTKAVDLWSLGCVTAVVLTGYTPFNEPFNSIPSDLEDLEDELDRLNTGPLARNFLRKLLVTDEERRLEVKQALRHSWFTNVEHARRFEELYRTIVREWRRPVHPDGPGNGIVDLASFAKSASTAQAGGQVEARVHARGPEDLPRKVSIDHVSESEYEDIPEYRTASSSLLSTSILSESLLPAHKRTGATVEAMALLAFGPRTHQHEEIRHHPAQNLSDLRSVHASTRIANHIQPKPSRPGQRVTVQNHPSIRMSGAHFHIRNQHHQHMDPSPLHRLSLSSQKLPWDTKKRPLPHESSSPPQTHGAKPTTWTISKEVSKAEDDQVYEEVRNPVTGKRQRLIYGRGMEMSAGLV